MRSDAKKEERNHTVLSELKTLSKKLVLLKDEPAKAVEFAKTVISKYDRAVSRGVIPKGRASRKKSRIANFLANLGATPKAASTAAKPAKKAVKKAVKKSAKKTAKKSDK